MSISVGDVLKIVAVMNYVDGSIAENVFAAVIGGTGGPYDNADIVDDALDWLETMYANLVTNISDELSGSEVRVYEYDSVDDDFDEVGSTSWVYSPSLGTDMLPHACSALINMRTTDADVSGKKFMAGISEASSVQGLLAGQLLTDLAAFAADWGGPFTGAVSGADWVPGVWSPTKTNFFASAESYVIPTIVAYQRRRKPGVGA